LDGVPLFGERAAARPAIFSEHRWFEGGSYVARLVESGTLKLHDVRDGARGRERQELYDLGSDGDERHDLLGDPPPAALARLPELRAQLSEFGVGVALGAAPTVSHIDPQTAERLRLLGYEEERH
jgi:hypothetical protein